MHEKRIELCLAIDCQDPPHDSTYPYCITCMDSIYGLRVGQSTIPNMSENLDRGLFTTRAFPKGFLFQIPYGGKVFRERVIKMLNLIRLILIYKNPNKKKMKIGYDIL